MVRKQRGRKGYRKMKGTRKEGREGGRKEKRKGKGIIERKRGQKEGRE